jgi:hypothetical protein
VPTRETAPRSCAGGPTPTPPGRIRRSAISCPSGLVELPDDVGADLGWVRSRPEGDPDAPLVRARLRREPHPPKTPGRERISGPAARRAAGPSSSTASRSSRRSDGSPRPTCASTATGCRVPDDGDAAHSCGAYMSSLIDCLCRFRSCPRCSSRLPWGWLLARPQTDSSARSTGARGRQGPPGSETAFDRRRAAQRHR